MSCTKVFITMKARLALDALDNLLYLPSKTKCGRVNSTEVHSKSEPQKEEVIQESFEL